jgi:hypothetical protein
LIIERYTLPDLVELRSRALLIANLAKGTHFKKVTPSSEDPQTEKNDLEAAANVAEFVKLVDFAQGIAEILMKLKLLGHFSFQNSVSVVNLGTPIGVCLGDRLIEI